jgi:hypothetical protein
VVDCEDAKDLAIVDRGDPAANCETVDRGAARRVKVGPAVVRPVKTSFELRLPDAHRFFKLGGRVKVPIGSTVNPNAGVRLATARNRTGTRQEISVRGGIFTVRQRLGRQPVTEPRLAGGDFSSCRR